MIEAALVDLVMEAALVYLEVEEAEAPVLTLLGLTHSAWWESSLVLEMGLWQNSQGIMTTSSLESCSVTLLWVTTSAAVADLDSEELVTRLMLLDLKVKYENYNLVNFLSCKQLLLMLGTVIRT